MKVLFSNPPWWVESKDAPLRRGIRAGSRWPHTVESHFKPNGWKVGSYAPFPFFMGYAASYLQRARPDAEVSVRDSVARGEDYEQYGAWLEGHRPAFIVIESATPSWEHDRNTIEIIKDRLPYTKIILTGPITMTDPAKLLTPEIFAAVRGEYEKGVVEAVGGRAGLIEHRIMSQDEMQQAPFPMFDEDVADRYWDANPKGNVAPQLQVWGSRGCWAKCVFCVWPAVMTGNDPDGTGVRKVRFYKHLDILAFIEERQRVARGKGKEIKSIYFDDDTGNLTDNHTLGICGIMRHVNLPWTMMCRADTIRETTWDQMKACGCVGVKIGFESGVQRVVDEIINKKLDLQKAAQTCRHIRAIGMTVHGTFTVGLPGETDDDKKATIQFIRDLYETGALDTHQLSQTAEIEGTPLANLPIGGSLSAYPGALKDEDYHSKTDGALNMPNI